MSSAAFKALSASLLDEHDAALLDQFEMDPILPNKEGPSYAEPVQPCGCEFIDRYREWERCLRLNAARHRATKTKRENAAPVDPPFFPNDAAAAAIKAVTAGDSPLETEILLDKARWSAIDLLAGNYYFDRNTVFAYYLKLVLLERKISFNDKEGFSEYKSLYASILENANLGEPK
ncbi:MAG: DUF2764 domain-containing protein [Treponema sp.]|jgi:hypothetical protein|nr:DUF2764 domain-containing protein [Treponema sp.]